MTLAETVSEVLRSVVEMAKPGVNLLALEKRAETTMQVLGAESVNKGYHPKWATSPFPSVVCLGVNDVIAHAIPTSYDLQDGDLLYIDTGVRINNLCGDAGLTVPIGEISNRDERLLRFAKRALYEGIRAVKPGIKVTEIGEAIYWFARRNGYIVNRVFMGHGIGKQMHEVPQIPHFPILPDEKYIPPDSELEPFKKKGKYEYKEKEGVPRLVEGQVICLEPMLTYKDPVGKKDGDGWTQRTRDGKKSAFFEHMIRVVTGGYEILTNHIKEQEEVKEDGAN